jgi:hypothetical protein
MIKHVRFMLRCMSQKVALKRPVVIQDSRLLPEVERTWLTKPS